MNTDNQTNNTYSNQRICARYRKIDIDWEFFRDIPIEEVADILGIEVNRNGRFLCPCHNDTNPSAHLKPKGKNTWCCYTCGYKDAGGSPIDLVMAVEGISAVNAVKFLNQYYPGGIRELETDEDKNVLTPPCISPQRLKEIGLKSNPFTEQNIRGILYIDKDGKSSPEQEKLRLSYEDAANLVIDKLSEYINSWRSYVENILQNFPDLDSRACSYMWETVKDKIDVAKGEQELFREFLIELAKSDEKNTWNTEMTEEEERVV